MLKYVHDVKRHLALYSMVDIVTGKAQIRRIISQNLNQQSLNQASPDRLN